MRDARASAETAERVWVIKRSELEAQSRSLAGRISEIAEHLGQIEKAGPDGICPTCERPLGDEYGKVTGEMSEQIADYRATIQANEVELKLLTKLPIEVNAAKSAIAQLDGSLNDARKREFAARSAGNELAEEQKQVAEVETRAAANRMRMEKIASGFDPAELDRLVRRGQELKPKRDRARELAVKADRREVVSKDVVEQQKSYDKIVAGLAGKTKERDDLGFEPDQHKAVLQQWTVAGQRVQASREQALTAEADVNIAEGSLHERVQEETAHRERAKSLETKRESMRYTEYLTTTFDRFRESLNGEINPRLSESASDLISDITDGRYTEVDLDEEYTPRLFDDGEWKPVISGGEEDVLHLTMRLAISQMIADRAGMDLGLLVLDEVFGSLDESRRENVINLLQNLKGRFQQILLITHIESIHDMVDRAIWVDYDTASGSSRIREVREPFEAAGSEAMESELHPSLSPN